MDPGSNDLLRACHIMDFSGVYINSILFYNALNSIMIKIRYNSAGRYGECLLHDKKSQAPVPVKAVEESCVTCGGAHAYRNCPATDGNVYRGNIQEYVSQAVAANFNQGNTGYRALIANQI
ncbi:hypothetical protein Tco_1057670 [Tanacetum coccineum]|uniref:Reverse transcriptase domain-containing protein n=1 Tax=Tanacetum coccineum TaxID=301880 RepID=A0ABQ5H618_9ASTR